MAVGRRGAQQLAMGGPRLPVGRTQIGPNDAPSLMGGVRADLHLRLEERVRRLRRHVDAGAVAIELPAVVNAPQAALFVAAEEHRRAAMRAKCIEQADLA